MRRVLLSWIGRADLRGRTEPEVSGVGPIAQALDVRAFDDVLLLSDYSAAETDPFVEWLRNRTSASVSVAMEKLSGPTNFGEIYEAAVRGCARAVGDRPRDVALTFHLSPGTPAMAAVWLLLGKTRFRGDFLESSRDHGVHTAAVPFDIFADFIPDLLRGSDDALRDRSSGDAPISAAFSDIIHRSAPMKRVLGNARKVAAHNLPVLIEGESGTGKELLARAIHRASPRAAKQFVAVNCGAIPAELVESELFGHQKGAFTGAQQAKAGYFEAAHGGTLFLDEVGELSLAAQVKLLRVLQEGAVVRLGATKPLPVDVRIIAATNRRLMAEVTAGRFREDLFHRLAVAILDLPALRDRPGDFGPLLDHLMGQVNFELSAQPGYRHKVLSAGARNLLAAHSWPGNVRELTNTLKRAALWSEEATISAEEAHRNLLSGRPLPAQEMLDRPLGDGFDVRTIVRDVARHYLGRAMTDARGNKSEAARLLGLPSYQTLTNWLKRHEVQL